MKTTKFIIGILFSLLPGILSAQSLITQYEYWFDDDVEHSVPVDISGSDFYINPTVSTSELSDGIHMFCIRVKQSDGWYSPICSSYFFKHNANEGDLIEYWFDENYSQKVSMPLPSTSGEEGVTVSLDLLDTQKFPFGFHRLNMRVSTKGKSLGPVYSANVMKLMSGDATTIEYWFDDGYANKKTLNGSRSGGLLVFDGELDCSDIPSGVHNLFYRVASSHGEAGSVVSRMTVMVKSRYVTEAKNSNVVSYSVAVDNETPIVMDVLNPSNELTIPYTYDARALSAGEHTLKAKMWNSFGTTTVEKTTFKVVEQEAPSIVLEASEKDGIVTATFNSIPNDLRYRIIRQDANENKAKVADFWTSYPNAIIKTDEPVEGSYTYFVQAVYTDYQGNKCLVTSNEVAVTVAKAEETSEPKVSMGSIIGCIKIDNQQVGLMPLNLQMDVAFSDGVTVKSMSNGMFIREGIPVGTELSMTVKNNPYYTFDSPSVVVDKTTSSKLLVINATTIKNQVVEKGNDSYDIVITSRITGIPHSFDFDVKNATGKKWSGDIEVLAIKQSDDKKSETSQELKSGQPVSFSSHNSYQKVGSVTISNFEPGATQQLNIQLSDLPSVSKDTYYQMYIVSKPKDSQTGAYKLLECLDHEVANPKEFLVEAVSGDHDYTEFTEEEVNRCIAEVLETMKALDKTWGPMSKALSKASDALEKYERDKDIDGLFGNLPELLKDFSTGLKDGIRDVKNVTVYLNGVKKFYDTINKAKEIENADDFTKFYELSKIVIDLSGDPFGKVYKVYLDAAKKAVDKILELSRNLYEYHIANSFFEGYTNFEIKMEKKNPGWFENDFYQGTNVAKRIEKVDIYCISVLANGTEIRNARTYLPNLSSDGRSCKLIDCGFLRGADGDLIKEAPQMEKVKRFWMEIEWKSGRKSIAPLLSEEFAEMNNRGQQDKTYIVSFKSEASDKDHMDYKLKLKCKDSSLNE